jgi:predicted regulator of Ras-like GTPase activity (Roadblock/LC7/MglB family)
MKDGLKEINELIGVWGSFIANNRGDVFLSLTPPGLKKPVLENISRQAIELLVSSGDRIQDLSEIVFHYSQKKLFIVDLEKAILAVVCTPSVDISLLRMTVNVVKTSWDSDEKVQSLLQKNYLERV